MGDRRVPCLMLGGGSNVWAILFNTYMCAQTYKIMFQMRMKIRSTSALSDRSTHSLTDSVLNHLQCCHKLNSADESQRLSRREVELDGVQEVCVVHLDIHKHIQHLNTCCVIYRDCRDKKNKERQFH